MKVRIQNIFNKLDKIILILLMIVSTINLNGISSIFADSADNVGDYPKNETLKYNGKISWSGNIVGDFTIGGQQAFCMQHPVATPGNNGVD